MMEGKSAFKDNSRLPTIDFVSITQALVVAECLSFHRAARVLGNEPSTVGRRVRALEDVLGVRAGLVALIRPAPAGPRRRKRRGPPRLELCGVRRSQNAQKTGAHTMPLRL